MPPLSLYVHIPWCIKKCPYCDFNSHAAKANLPESAYIDALLNDLTADLERYAITRPIHSIFIGGGTPSLFSPESLDCLISGIRQHVKFEETLEITLEANPGTFESEKFKEFNALGINRLSIGIQSFNDDLLAKLGRVHSGQNAIRAAEIAHDAGFANFNLDLMFGLPGAVPGDSEQDVKTAIDLKPTHISFYQLTLEPNTLFHKYPPKLPDDEFIYTTQKNCQGLLTDNNYQQYEISAYSQPGKECRHNLNYWQFGDYLGIGAGAHGKITNRLPNQIIRSFKAKSPELYLQNPSQGGGSQTIAFHELPLEFIMNQLRLRCGFTLNHYQNMTGLAATTLQPTLSDCQKQGLVTLENGYYACTDKGWDFLDTVLGRFVA
ncbi:radical SAM family heme chaperone HemW [Methyloglobulus sp.]|uniref:radical SAM family heme chaperone HemW n=1 Tax=Methyloglobulus sp. TaxID=2518622 RepID=UPI0032B770D7